MNIVTPVLRSDALDGWEIYSHAATKAHFTGSRARSKVEIEAGSGEVVGIMVADGVPEPQPYIYVNS